MGGSLASASDGLGLDRQVARGRAGCTRFPEEGNRVQRYHADSEGWRALSRVDRCFSRALPRKKDRQDRRDRCARISFRFGGFVPLRKKGRLPYKTESAKYSLEYGEAEMELHIDAITRGEQVILIDDLLATGGTSASAATLIKKIGGELVEAIFLIELEFLHGREKLAPTPVISFLKY